MNQTDFNYQMKRAVARVMESLPDKRVDREKAMQYALGGIILDDDYHWTEAIMIIEKLIKLSPICYGTKRKKAYWKIVLGFLTTSEAVEYYLKKFPREITDRQRQSIVNYLVDELGFGFEEVNRRLANFGRLASRRKNIREMAANGIYFVS